MNADMETAKAIALARYKEACARADDTIDAQRDGLRSKDEVIAVQRQIIEMLHQQIGRLEQQVEELKAGL